MASHCVAISGTSSPDCLPHLADSIKSECSSHISVCRFQSLFQVSRQLKYSSIICAFGICLSLLKIIKPNSMQAKRIHHVYMNNSHNRYVQPKSRLTKPVQQLCSLFLSAAKRQSVNLGYNTGIQTPNSALIVRDVMMPFNRAHLRYHSFKTLLHRDQRTSTWPVYIYMSHSCCIKSCTQETAQLQHK